MTNKTIDELIAAFESGDTPTGEDFADLIRLCYNNNVKYKIVERETEGILFANYRFFLIPLDEAFYENSSISLYHNGVLIPTKDYVTNFAYGSLKLTFNSTVNVDRTFIVKATKIEDVTG